MFAIINTLCKLALMADSLLVDTKRLWTKMEYHKKTGMSRMTIDKMIKEKSIPTVKINGTVLIVK